MSEKPLHLEFDAIHLGGLTSALPVAGFGNDYERYMATHCSEGDAGRLVSLATSTEDWPVWETTHLPRKADDA
jgi:L-alanine-DL-glutamate epimerase-like enolase superfamily enzyme